MCFWAKNTCFFGWKKLVELAGSSSPPPFEENVYGEKALPYLGFPSFTEKIRQTVFEGLPKVHPAIRQNFCYTFRESWHHHPKSHCMEKFCSLGAKISTWSIWQPISISWNPPFPWPPGHLGKKNAKCFQKMIDWLLKLSKTGKCRINSKYNKALFQPDAFSDVRMTIITKHRKNCECCPGHSLTVSH